MDHRTLSGFALEVVELIQSDDVFRGLIEQHPDLLALFIRAAEAAAANTSDRARLLEGVALVISTSERAVDAMCKGSDDLPELMLHNSRASEDLGRLLKQLYPPAVPIGVDAIKAATN
jgi:hypothetical protein